MDRIKIKEVLKTVPLFKELTSNELEEIVNIAQNRQFLKGTHVFMQDDPLENVYFIYAGKVKIYKNDFNGREQIVSVLKNGDMFPHVGFFRKGNYPAYAHVIEDATLVVISISHFEMLLLQHPQVCIKLFRVMGEKIVDLQNRLEAQILNNTYEQIIKLLLRLSETDGKIIDDGRKVFTTNYTNKDLANMIGSTRETVSRTLTKLKKKEIINVNSHGNLIIDVEKLEDELFI
ncbi:Crp/Fnr family transcriptional regulator [Ferdinandcohnia quinoae]|uniref:Crp/Fnr family transcriptional regulator n=1 Tax=Fredinandcohnia quinoae TaxID=2918902 RepID=A0AAW5DWH6_9BACI|nr:Crp/Fnr family transcriptional regulator [Fredinandcohnia sp. SECRCQ15]MCH1624698.1 Crp/Fnr family transcriptional regulator [Fredinandcohnia sp. SECRCQ15]